MISEGLKARSIGPAWVDAERSGLLSGIVRYREALAPLQAALMGLVGYLGHR
jgi:hypothetical protein